MQKPMAYGNKLVGNNHSLHGQCYNYTMIFPDYIANSLTFPDSAQKDTFPLNFLWPYKPDIVL